MSNDAAGRLSLTDLTKIIFDHIRNTTICMGILLASVWGFSTREIHQESLAGLSAMFYVVSVIVAATGVLAAAINILDGWNRIDGCRLSVGTGVLVRLLYVCTYACAFVLLFAYAIYKNRNDF